jgi:hypothetical protein
MSFRIPAQAPLARFASIAAFFAACLAAPAHAAGEEAYFYHRYDYGSQAAFNPVSVLVNGGYDMLQTRAMSNHVASLDYRHSMANVADNLFHPAASIGEYGWKQFAQDELYPSDLSLKNAQWVPNYSLHLIGDGLTFRTLTEWYASHGMGHPALMAAANCLAYEFMNEAVENGANRSTNVDAIADMLVFDPLGMLLFSNDRVARFFGETLHAANWSAMPLLNAGNGQLDNASLSFAFKYLPMDNVPVGLFYYAGINTVGGFTWRYDKEYSLSFGGGIGTIGIIDVDQANGQRKSTAVLGKTAALFWDRNNSLLASLVISNQRLYTARLNVYPLPAMSRWRLKPGFFLARGFYGELFMGAALTFAPVGISYYFK